MLSIPGITKRDVTANASTHGDADAKVTSDEEVEKILKKIKDDEIKKSHIEQYDEDHCDYKCQLRMNSVEKHYRKKHGIVQVDDKHVCVATPSKLDRDERKKLSVCLKQAGLLAHHDISATAHTKASTDKKEKTPNHA